MSATVHAATRSWAHVHRAALVIVLLSLALAATLGLLGASILAGPDARSATSGSTDLLLPGDNACQQLSRPGSPC